jgi:hypothetical protein
MKTMWPLLSALCLAAAAPQDPPAPAVPQQEPTRLTRDEMAAGWTLLFDGRDTSAWRAYRGKDLPAKGWSVQDGALVHQKGGGGGDLVTRRTFRNFELQLEYRVAAGGNSGIVWGVAETEAAAWQTGPEFQILDDDAHQGAEAATRTGALYGLYAPTDPKLRPPGEWNAVRILVLGDDVEHWLNGERIVAAKRGSEDWRKRVAASKFAAFRDFGRVERGHICLQDHGDEVAFRRVLIRELPPPDRRLDEVALFDGKDTSQWSAFLLEGKALADVWSVQDGILVCKGKPAGYLYTNRDFASFVLEVVWRWNPDTKQAGNSGVLFRMTGEHKVWPRSIEAQLMSENAGDFWNIGDFPMQVDKERTRGRNTRKTHGNERPIGEWNEYQIIADGPWVQLRVNGQVLNEAWDCEVVPGRICLQSEGAEIQFKSVRIVELH